MATMATNDRGQLQVLNLQDKLSLFHDRWLPRVIGEFNDNQLKLTKLQGDFIWHSHAEADEVFFVIAGEFDMDFRDRTVTVRAGELLVVPRNVEHKPRAERECHILLIEPQGIVNTGNAGGERTAPNDVWI